MMPTGRLVVAARITAIACLAIVGALCVRYLYLDNDAMRTFCDTSPDRWFCTTRTTVSAVLHHPAMGWGVLVLALASLFWPSAWRLGIAMVIAALGLVFYQADLSSGAAALLLLRLAAGSDTPEQRSHSS